MGQGACTRKHSGYVSTRTAPRVFLCRTALLPVSSAPGAPVRTCTKCVMTLQEHRAHLTHHRVKFDTCTHLTAGSGRDQGTATLGRRLPTRLAGFQKCCSLQQPETRERSSCSMRAQEECLGTSAMKCQATHYRKSWELNLKHGRHEGA